MNAKQLLAHFERISEAPDALARLRQFIIDLAVNGRLAEQYAADEPAQDLLKRIHQERQSTRGFAPLDEAELDSPLPGIPNSWIWTVVDQLAADHDNAITDGPFGANLKTEHYVSTPGFRVVRLQNVGRGMFREEHRSYIDGSRFERLVKHHVFGGDLVVAGLVDPLVRCCELPHDIGPALVKADCYRLAVHPHVSSRYVCLYLNSSTAQLFASAHHHGMTLTRIGLGNFRKLPFPLPPSPSSIASSPRWMS